VGTPETDLLPTERLDVTTPEDPFAAPTEGAGGVPAYGQQQSPPPYGQPAGYGGPPPYGMPGAAPRNGFGIAALVLGILAVLGSITVVGGVLFGLLAIVFGALGRGRAKRGEANNGGLATTGLVLGIIGVLLSAALIAVGVSLFNSDSGKKLQDCLNNAGSNAAAQQQCQDEFRNNLTK
jgi:hypothetical protein